MADTFYIGPYDSNSGQDTSVTPFMIPDNAFQELTNAYVFRGRVRKRFGSRLLGNSPVNSRLRVQVGTLSSPSSPVPGSSGALGQMFSAGQVLMYVHQASGDLYVANGTASTATFTIATGAFSISGVSDSGGSPLAGSTPLFWYPSLPVMGLLTREVGGINNEQTIAFDTKYAYQYVTSPMGWERLASFGSTSAEAEWSGSNAQFFQGANWTGSSAQERFLFVTNFNENELQAMRYLDTSDQWNSFKPAISATENLNSARLLIPFKNRLVALNTWEGAAIPGTHYPFRARYSGIGSPVASNAWRQDIPGNGNAIDAPTTESIIGAEFVRDRLVVFFERSTWELVYTGNQIYPFAWQQLNTELGAESTFSVVPFDKVALGIGNVGIHACNGVNVERIDSKIPDAVFRIHNSNEGVARVYGIRDYKVEMVYWTFPGTDTTGDFPFPNRVLVYSYVTGTWAFNFDSITCYGYYQPASGITWNSMTVTWDDDVSWDSGALQARFRDIIGGNQEGYTFIVDPDSPTNAPVIQITDLSVSSNVVTVTAYDHNFRQGEYVRFSGVEDSSGNLTLLNGNIYRVSSYTTDPSSATPDSFEIIYEDENGTTLSGTYSGGGLIARVSNITLLTKQFSFYAQKNRNFHADRVDFLVDRTFAGETTVDYFTSTSLTSTVDNELAPLGNNALETFAYPTFYPYERNATQVWRPVYFDAEGSYIQFKIEMTPEQVMKVETDDDGNQLAPALEDFTLHAMIITASPTSMRLQ